MAYHISVHITSTCNRCVVETRFSYIPAENLILSSAKSPDTEMGNERKELIEYWEWDN